MLSRLLAAAVLNTLVAQSATAQTTALPNAPTAPAAAARPTSDDLHNRLRGQVWAHWQRGEFALLETWAAELRDPARAAADGYPYAVVFYPSFWTAIGPDPARYKEMEARWTSIFDRWKKAYPKSATPYFVHAAFLMERAKALRGEGYINTLTKQQQVQAALAFSKAYDFLMANMDRMREDYAWWHMTFRAGLNAGMSHEVMYLQLAEGITKFPGIGDLHTIGALYLTPRWGGSWEEFNIWVEASMAASQERYGLAMYPRIYGAVGYEPGIDKLFRSSKRHWELAKAGLRDIERTSKTAKFYEMAVSLSCRARDEVTFEHYWSGWRVLAPTVGDKPPMADYCDYERQTRRDATAEAIPLPKIM